MFNKERIEQLKELVNMLAMQVAGMEESFRIYREHQEVINRELGITSRYVPGQVKAFRTKPEIRPLMVNNTFVQEDCANCYTVSDLPAQGPKVTSRLKK